MAYDIGPRVGIDGEAQFRKEIQQITENIKTLGSEFKVVASAADAEGESIESLSQKNEILNRTVTELEKRLTAQRNMLDKSTQLYGEADSRTQKWQRTVNATETELNKLRGQINKNNTALDKLENATDDADNAIEDLGDSADSAGSKLSAMTVAMGNLISSGIQAAVSAVSNLVSSIWNLDESTEEYRTALGKVDTAFSTSAAGAEAARGAYNGLYNVIGDTDTAAEAAQLLARLATNTGDVATWTDIAAGVAGTFGDALPINSLIEASNETAKVGTVTGTLADALNWAGISEDEFNEKLAACADESERANLIMDTLSGTYEQASEAFYENNEALVTSRRNQTALNNAMAALGETAATIKNQLITAFIPSISSLATAFNDLLNGVEGADEQLGQAIDSFISAIAEQLPQVLEMGTQILTSLISGIIQALPTLVEEVPQIIEQFASALVEIGSQLLDTGAELLGKLTTGIETGLPDMVSRLPQIIDEFLNFITEHLPDILDQGVEMLTSLTNGILDAIPEFASKLPEIITSFVNFISDNLPDIISSGAEILGSLISGIIDNIPDLVAELPKIIDAIVTGITELLGDIIDVGWDIVEGIWQGITEAAGWLTEKITGWFNGVVDGVKSFLGIASPSKVFAGIGKNMGLGIGEGFENSMGTVQREINRAMGGLLPDVSGNVSVTGSTASSGGVGSGAADFAGAISRALSGAVVYMDGRKVGQLITRQQNNTIRANGLVPTI